jgi:hypothetical protein
MIHNTAQSGVLAKVKENMKNTSHLAKSLIDARIVRVSFDAFNPIHRSIYKHFVNTGKWELNFKVEEPYKDVVRLVEQRLIDYALRGDQPHVP